jgi:hypothetical protein
MQRVASDEVAQHYVYAPVQVSDKQRFIDRSRPFVILLLDLATLHRRKP